MDFESRKARYRDFENTLRSDIAKINSFLGEPNLTSAEELFLKSTLSNLNSAMSRVRSIGNPSKALLRQPF